MTKALLDGCIKGVGKYFSTSIFPCGIFQYMKGINNKPGTPNYDLYRLALKSTAKRLYPNYTNIDWSGNKGYDPDNPCTYMSTMGCRTANGADINATDPKLVQLKDGRGNAIPVTVIMPTIAMETKLHLKEGEDLIEKFIHDLDVKIHEAKDMLIERFNWLAAQSADAAKFMYENNIMYGYNPEEGIISALKHCTLSLGQLGLAETLMILIGKYHNTKEGMDLAIRIEKLFSDRCKEFKQQYKLNFGVYYSPAESLCGTAMKKFKAKYGVIPGISDKEWFTNSDHIPVDCPISIFDKIDIEAELSKYSSAGCITYIELDGAVSKNIDALEEIVNYSMEKDCPYFAVNVPVDKCNDCGYEAEIPDKCPKCGSNNIKRLRRVTGYLTGDYKSAFNFAKQAESEHRIKHNNQMSELE